MLLYPRTATHSLMSSENFAEDALNITVHAANKDVKQCW